MFCNKFSLFSIPTQFRCKYLYRVDKHRNWQIRNQSTVPCGDRDAPGRETMTISKVRSGVYSYSVKNFEDKSSAIDDSESTNFRKSRAKVKVLYCSAEPCETTSPTFYRKKFHVPNDNGTLWRVFTFDSSRSGSGFTRVDNMTYENTAGNIY